MTDNAQFGLVGSPSDYTQITVRFIYHHGTTSWYPW